MTLVDHLAELRDRIVKVLIVVDPDVARRVLLRDADHRHPRRAAAQQPLQFTGLGDAFYINVKIAIVVGIILAMPVILYQVWAFIAPGLTAPSGGPSGHGSRSRSCSSRSAWPSRTSSCRSGPVPAGLPETVPRRRSSPRAVLRLRDDDVPRVRPDHGVPDPPGRPVAGRDRDLGAAASRRGGWRSSSSRSSRRPRRPGGDLVSPFVLGITMYVLFEGTIFVIRRSGK